VRRVRERDPRGARRAQGAPCMEGLVGRACAAALRAPMCSVRAHVCMPRKRARLAVRCASLSTLRSS
jgi:hypothetical protein